MSAILNKGKQGLPLSNLPFKRGQLKIQQMIFMLIAVTLFFVLVLLFYLSIKFAGLEQSKDNLERDKAIGIATKIASSAEFNFEGKSRAVDTDKIMALKNKEDYKNYWGVDDIIIEKIYPIEEDEECDLRNYPNCNKIIVIGDGKGEFIHSYVALCRKEIILGNAQDRCEIGLLKIK